MRGIALALPLLLYVSAAFGTDVAQVYYLGDCLPATSPIGYIGDDPAIDVIAVPATVHDGYFTESEAQRALRLYLPRTYQELADGALILLSDVRADTLPTKWLNWFSESVERDGLGLMMIGGWLSFGGHTDSPSWDITSIGPILPVELLDGQIKDVIWRPVVVSPEDPLMTTLPWESCPHFGGYNVVMLKEGAHLLAQTNDAVGNPFMALMTVGEGRSFAFCTDWTPGWGAAFMEWDFYADLTVYSVYYSCGKEVPQDLALMHAIRTEMIAYTSEKDALISFIAFVEKVGANVVRLEEKIKDAETRRLEADEHYILQEYEDCDSMLKEARVILTAIEAETVEVKNGAFLWIWAIEWMAVTSTLMITGSLLWALMIKRRLYRDVGTTRMI